MQTARAARGKDDLAAGAAATGKGGRARKRPSPTATTSGKDLQPAAKRKDAGAASKASKKVSVGQTHPRWSWGWKCLYRVGGARWA